jgi:hypothetical protein
VELWLAWRRVAKDVQERTLGSDFDRSDFADIQTKIVDAEGAAKDEIWAGYRFVVISGQQEPDGIKTIDLGAGHASQSETLCGRVLTALKSQALLNESVGAGYIDRNWPPALKESAAWPLTSLRQSFLNGALTRLLDPDSVLRGKIVEFVGRGDFGLASGPRPDGSYDRVWYEELIAMDEVAFESGVVLLTKTKAKALKTGAKPDLRPTTPPTPGSEPSVITAPVPEPEPEPGHSPVPQFRTLHLVGTVPPELWNRLGTKLIPKLRSGTDLKVSVDFSVTLTGDQAQNLESELRQILDDLGLSAALRIQKD